MASENVENWDLPLPKPAESEETEEEELTKEERRRKEYIEKLEHYVGFMSYSPIESKKSRKRTESLAKTRRRTLIDNSKQFRDIMVPPSRGQHLKRLADVQEPITVEQLEKVIRSAKTKDRHKENVSKKKEEIYYDLLTKLELQCRTQYLNLVLKKFANFIAKLSTTMRVPPKLFDPYARMQRGIFCNILQAIGVEPSTQASIYYNTKEGTEYAVCHKLSHALLSLIIKALDLASTRNPNAEPANLEPDFKMDSYIKDRLMRAAEKKVLGSKYDRRNQFEDESLDKKLENCECNI